MSYPVKQSLLTVVTIEVITEMIVHMLQRSVDNCCIMHFFNINNIKEHFTSLWPSDSIWRHKSGSTLAQVMASCLMAPSHYLNQCSLIIDKVLWGSCEDNFTRDT